LYDKVPYTEALKGKEGMVAAPFDNGDAVYDDLILKIDEALGWIDLSASAITPGNDDLIYSGDMEQWQKFGNTLKLKIYIRQALARPEVAQAGIASLYTNGANFLGTGDDAFVGFSANVHNENPLWQELNQTTFENLVASNTSLDDLKNAGDPRLDGLYDPSPDNGQYIGLDQGIGTQDGGQFDDYARPDNTTIINRTAGVSLMTDYESLFMQAEAAARGWSTENDKALYDAAVSASFAFWGDDASGFIGAGGDYEYDGELETIYYQKWLAFNGKQGMEGWIEWRRTGVPDLPISLQGRPLPNTFPLRLIWPITERSANPNVPAVTSVDTPVWWDTTY
ncbi:MAG TPA: SusD/RagB family nutrient-binding outer membrane lipoprotein, partial [Cyclobacteriaceae bacterium]|nr:SusD/RagB family nutrient-binding outer membrane lipoprotein [Cyclobacteriaceae bacterium]